MKPPDYKHIAAFFRDDPAARRRQQRWAAIRNAPIDAVYLGPDGWVTFSSVGVQTRMSIERALNHGVTRK